MALCSCFTGVASPVIALGMSLVGFLCVWPWFPSPCVTASSRSFRLLVWCLSAQSRLQVVGALDRPLRSSGRAPKGGLGPPRHGGPCRPWPCSGLSAWEVAGEAAVGVFRSFLLGRSEFPERNPQGPAWEGASPPSDGREPTDGTPAFTHRGHHAATHSTLRDPPSQPLPGPALRSPVWGVWANPLQHTEWGRRVWGFSLPPPTRTADWSPFQPSSRSPRGCRPPRSRWGSRGAQGSSEFPVIFCVPVLPAGLSLPERLSLEMLSWCHSAPETVQPLPFLLVSFNASTHSPFRRDAGRRGRRGAPLRLRSR